MGCKLDIAASQTKDRVRETYGQRFPSFMKPAQIHVVSNTLYADLLNLSESGVKIPSPVELTGIPELRTRIRALVESPQIRRLKNHIETVLPDALSNILLWSDPSQIDMSKISQPILDRINQIPNKSLTEPFETFSPMSKN